MNAFRLPTNVQKLRRHGVIRPNVPSAGKLEGGFAVRALPLIASTRGLIASATNRSGRHLEDSFGSAGTLGQTLASARLPEAEGGADTRTTLFRLEALVRHYTPLAHKKDLEAIGAVKGLEDALGELGLRADMLELGQGLGAAKLGPAVLKRLEKDHTQALEKLEPLAWKWAYGDTLAKFGNAVARADTKKHDLSFLRSSIAKEVDSVLKKSAAWDKDKSWEWKSSKELYEKVLEGMVHESKRNVRWFLIDLPGLGGGLQLSPPWEPGDNPYMRPPAPNGSAAITVPKSVMNEFSQYVTRVDGLKTRIENVWHLADTMRRTDKSLGDKRSLRQAEAAIGERPLEELLREAREVMVAFKNSRALERYKGALLGE